MPLAACVAGVDFRLAIVCLDGSVQQKDAHYGLEALANVRYRKSTYRYIEHHGAHTLADIIVHTVPQGSLKYKREVAFQFQSLAVLSENKRTTSPYQRKKSTITSDR